MLAKIMMLLLVLSTAAAISEGTGFTYNGFRGAKLRLDGIAKITPNGLLRLTNTTLLAKGHAFYPTPFHFKNSSTGKALSFSTYFVFAIVPRHRDLTGHGIAFFLSRSTDLSYAFPSQYLGLFNQSGVDSSHQIVAVELDINMNPEFSDMDNNHVGIDVNSPKSIAASHAAYFTTNDHGGGFKNLSLASGEPTQAWVDYDHSEGLLNITLAPIDVPKPSVPCLSSHVNLSSLVSNSMYVGFSSSVGSVITSHYILGWSFKLNGRAQALDLSRLPTLPREGPKPKSKYLIILLPIITVVLSLTVIAGAIFLVRRKAKFSELLEDWELEYGPHRFSYKDLFIATEGFREQQLLGAGGFGRVYKGVLPHTNSQVAVKRVSHESRQGMREFVAEITSIGRMRHRNLVQLLGYCRRKRELLLVYDFMPNGSLDKFIFDQPKLMLSWTHRFHIIKGVASGLCYLHEGCEKVVVHRDIKASNILLDSELNGMLGDFGLARLYDHGTDPQTTHVVGTLGYLAPELPKTGKATTSTDVFAFGGFLLEVACGRRPIEARASVGDIVLVDRVLECWKAGTILEARDPNLGNDYAVEEMELVLKLGLLCSQPKHASRPPMRLVMQILEGDAPLPDMSEDGWNDDGLSMGMEGFADITFSGSSPTSTVASSVLASH